MRKLQTALILVLFTLSSVSIHAQGPGNQPNASDVSISDSAGFFNTVNVEDALQEIGGSYAAKVHLDKFPGNTDAEKIANALIEIDDENATLVFGKQSYVTGGIEFPDNVVVELPAGALIEDFCIIRGGFVAPQGSKVFNSEVDMSKANISRVYASWWGVQSRTTHDYTTELQNAIASFGQVVLDAGFVAASNIVLEDGDWLYGAGDMQKNTNSSNYTMLMPATDNGFLVEVRGSDCGIKDIVFSMTNPVYPSNVAHTAIRNIDGGGLIVDNVKIQDGQGNNGHSSVDTCLAILDSSTIYSTYRNMHIMDVDHHVKTIHSNQILFKEARFNCQTSALNNDPAYTVHIKDGRNIIFNNCGFDVSQAHHAMTTIYVDNPTSVRLQNCYVETVQHPNAVFMSIGSRNARTTVDIVGMQQDPVSNPQKNVFKIRETVGGSLNIFGGIWNSTAGPVDYPGGNQGKPMSNLTVNMYGMVYANRMYPAILNFDSEKWDKNGWAGDFISNTYFGLSNASDVMVNTIETELTKNDKRIPTSGAVFRAINNRELNAPASGSGWIPWEPRVIWSGETPKTNKVKAYYQILNDKVEFFLQLEVETGADGVSAVALSTPTTPPDTDVDIIISEDCYFDNAYPPKEDVFGYIDLSNDTAGERMIRIPKINSTPGTEYDLKISGWYPIALP